jgi:phosphatidylglycerophosphate synthase
MGEHRGFLHYFGSRERPTVAAWVAWRDRALSPAYRALARRNVHADTVTLTSFLVVLFFFVPLLALKHYLAAWLALGVHLVLDALDGPMARTSGYSSNRGAIADIMNDITGMVVVVAATVETGWVDPIVGLLYVATYLYLIVFTIGLNVLHAGFRVVLKSKYWYYVALIITVHSGRRILTPFAVACVVYCVGYVLVAFMRLRDHLPEALPMSADEDDGPGPVPPGERP